MPQVCSFLQLRRYNADNKQISLRCGIFIEFL